MEVDVAASTRTPSPGSAPAEGDRRRRPRSWFVPTWTLAAAVLTAVAILIPLGPGAKGLAIVGVVIVPGATATALTGLALNGVTQRILLSLVVGIAGLLGVGLLCAVVLKPLGIEHPLTRGPMLVVWMLLLVASIVFPARRETDPMRWLLGGVSRRHCLWLAGLGILPALTLLGAGRLNAGHGAGLAIAACALCVGVLTFALVSTLWGRNYVPVAPTIFMTVVALVWQVSSRGDWLFGTDIQHEYSVANTAAVTGRFALTTHSDAYQAMLSLTVLPAQLHALSSASVEILLQFLPAAVLGLVAVGALCIFRSLASEGLAVGFTLLFVGVNTALVTELPAVTRQCYGLLMFESMVLIIVLAPQPIRRSRVLAATLGVAMAWSHYSTAYIAVPVLVVGWIFGWLFAARSSDAGDGQGVRSLRTQPEPDHVADRSRAVLSTAVVAVTVLAAGSVGPRDRRDGQPTSAIGAFDRDEGLRHTRRRGHAEQMGRRIGPDVQVRQCARRRGAAPSRRAAGGPLVVEHRSTRARRSSRQFVSAQAARRAGTRADLDGTAGPGQRARHRRLGGGGDHLGGHARPKPASSRS